MTDLNSAKQQADDDLTWLARNVNRWIDGDYLIRVGKIGYTFREHCEGETVLPNWYTRVQWLSRRAELQNKPSWDGVESDAEWIAQRPDGRWEFFNREPYALPGGGGWWKVDGFYKWLSQNVGEVLGDWRDTLERRPQAAKPEPSSDDWHKRGELPPVGTECEMFLDGNWEWVFIVGFPRHGHRHGRLVVENEFGDLRECINCKYRPLQTERERVAAELVDVMMAVPVSDRKTASESYMSMALAIYDHLHKESRV